MAAKDPRVERVAQALVDEHTKSWGGELAPLSKYCDAGYWRRLARAALAATEAA